MRTLQASVIDVRHGWSITPVAHPCHLTRHMTVNHGQHRSARYGPIKGVYLVKPPSAEATRDF
jgi:hypothetical protein